MTAGGTPLRAGDPEVYETALRYAVAHLTDLATRMRKAHVEGWEESARGSAGPTRQGGSES